MGKKQTVMVLQPHGKMGLGGGFGKVGNYSECRGSGMSVKGLEIIDNKGLPKRCGPFYKCPVCGSHIASTPKYNVHLEMIKLIKELELWCDDEARAFNRGNMAAGTRLRKACLDAQRRLKKIRDMVQDCKKEMKEGGE